MTFFKELVCIVLSLLALLGELCVVGGILSPIIGLIAGVIPECFAALLGIPLGIFVYKMAKKMRDKVEINW